MKASHCKRSLPNVDLNKLYLSRNNLWVAAVSQRENDRPARTQSPLAADSSFEALSETLKF